MVEHGCVKTMALGSIPGSSTFLSCPFAISEVFGRNGLIQRSSIRPGLTGLWTKLIGVPNHRTPSCDLAQILNDQNHTQLLSAFDNNAYIGGKNILQLNLYSLSIGS